ncbi:hypothetical protein K1719_028812 [Acacia pycnantha]|nr:hypothetical protein K1719_028812 [Acacia pycnantha]
MAVKEALLICGKFRYSRVCIEVDFEELYRCLIARTINEVKWQSVSTLSYFLLLVENRSEVSFSLVASQGNHAADLLAAAGSRKMEPNGWLETAPSLLNEVLLADSNSSEN